jgi:hypothetical protein
MFLNKVQVGVDTFDCTCPSTQVVYFCCAQKRPVCRDIYCFYVGDVDLPLTIPTPRVAQISIVRFSSRIWEFKLRTLPSRPLLTRLLFCRQHKHSRTPYHANYTSRDNPHVQPASLSSRTYKHRLSHAVAATEITRGNKQIRTATVD